MRLCDIREYLNIILSTLRICTWDSMSSNMKGCGSMEQKTTNAHRRSHCDVNNILEMWGYFMTL